MKDTFGAPEERMWGLRDDQFSLKDLFFGLFALFSVADLILLLTRGLLKKAGQQNTSFDSITLCSGREPDPSSHGASKVQTSKWSTGLN